MNSNSRQIELLETRWKDVLNSAPFSNKEDTNEWFNKIVQEYSKPSRAYHTLKHLEEMFSLLDDVQVQQKIKKMYIVVLSIFFHDVIYVGESKTNEEDSEALFQQFVKVAGLPKEDAELVSKYILQTKTHLKCTETEDLDMLYFLDIDLAILGTSNLERYKEYVRGVRKEYCHFNDEQFTAGRKAFLGYLQQHKGLYFTELFRGRLEAQAKQNIEWEMSSEEAAAVLYKLE